MPDYFYLSLRSKKIFKKIRPSWVLIAPCLNQTMKDNTKWTDEKLLAAIRGTTAEREEAFIYIYKHSGWRQWVIWHVQTRDGNEPDAKDVFQLSVPIFDRILLRDDFEKRSTLQTLFYKIAKQVWFNQLRKRKPLSEYRPDEPDPDADIEITFLTEERKRLIHAIIGKMDKTCRKLLPLWMLSYTNKEIAQELGLSSDKLAKKYADRCRKKFKKFLEDLGGLP